MLIFQICSYKDFLASLLKHHIRVHSFRIDHINRKNEKTKFHQPVAHQISHSPSRFIWWKEKTLHNVTRFLDKKQ